MATGVDREQLEQAARAMGERWARQIHSDTGGGAEGSAALWPRTLEQARQVLEDALGERMKGGDRESLALVLERSARAAWQSLQRSATRATGEIADTPVTDRTRLRS